MRDYDLRSLATKAMVLAAVLIGAYVMLVHLGMVSSVLPRVMSVGN